MQRFLLSSKPARRILLLLLLAGTAALLWTTSNILSVSKGKGRINQSTGDILSQNSLIKSLSHIQSWIGLNQPQNYSRDHFVDKLFEPILDVFRDPNSYARKSEFRSGSLPKVLVISAKNLVQDYWVNSLKQFSEHECPFECTFTANEAAAPSADAVLVYLSFFPSSEDLIARLPTRDPTQPWIVFSVETPSHNLIQKLEPLASLNGIFNRTMTYRRDSDVVFTHGFVVAKDEAKLLPPSWVTPMKDDIEKLPFSKRKTAVAFISNCKAPSGRMDYIQEVNNHINVDIYGKCGKFKCGSSRFISKSPLVQDDECLAHVAKSYLFYFSFENSFAEDYVTEKLYNILLYPVVPVVFGGANYSEILPPDSYISAVDYKPADLAKYLVSLSRNKSEYQKMLEWRKYYQVSTVGAERIFCDLCTKLHQPEFMEEKVYDNFEYWFKTLSNLKKYTADGIVPFL